MQTANPLFGRYEIVRELAAGHVSTVYEARDTHPQLRHRPTTLKVLRKGRDARHFIEALKINAALRHPRIPPAFEIGENQRRMYAARTFIEGNDLLDGIETAKPSVTQVTPIVADVAAALDHAHGQGIVHGSVHPRHVLLAKNGTAWLIGFGEYPPPEDIALVSPLHLAPEQLQGDGQATPASDVYALAETALWLLCGHHPFAGFQINELLTAKRTNALRCAVEEMVPDSTPAVHQVLQRGLTAEPVHRFATPGEFAAALESANREHASRRWWSWR